MFSKKYKLLQKTGPDGIGRYDYLRLLKKEFLETNSEGTIKNSKKYIFKQNICLNI